MRVESDRVRIEEFLCARERSLIIALHGPLAFFHYDLYGQALSKLLRGFDRDFGDAKALLVRRLIDSTNLRQVFALIEPNLILYPAIDSSSFRESVNRFCDAGR